MRIGGFQKISLIDYPGKVASVIFTQGCNFRCGYCHNPELVLPEKFNDFIPVDKIFRFLEKRKNQIEGVVVSGGEPTQQTELIPFLSRIRGLGYLVKLDTNGSHPNVLEKLIHLKLINYIAMDIKGPLKRYHEIVGVEIKTACIKESIAMILRSKLLYEFRTTLVKSLCSEKDLAAIVGLIPQAKRYVVQKFVPSEKIINHSLLQEEHYTEQEIDYFKKKWDIKSQCLGCCKACQSKGAFVMPHVKQVKNLIEPALC